jgi:hypothetical protein
MSRLVKLQYLIAALWVGSLWTVGYLVAPTLFATLSDTVLAGTIAGKIFRVEAWLSVGCIALLFVLNRAGSPTSSNQRRVAQLLGAMLVCTLVGYFGLQPFMAALREAAPGGVLSGSARTQFGVLHGVASGLYLIQSVLGILLLKVQLQYATDVKPSTITKG